MMLWSNILLLFTKVILKLFTEISYDHQPNTVMAFPFHAGKLRHDVSVFVSIFSIQLATDTPT